MSECGLHCLKIGNLIACIQNQLSAVIYGILSAPERNGRADFCRIRDGKTVMRIGTVQIVIMVLASEPIVIPTVGGKNPAVLDFKMTAVIMIVCRGKILTDLHNQQCIVFFIQRQTGRRTEIACGR